MLSVYRLKSAAVSGAYYKQGDYYTKDEDEELPSSWIGKGAESLGLTGDVDHKVFRELLEGQVAGQTVGRADGEGGRQHHPGWDFTFSAPKSVSIAALIGNDKRLISAHIEAVKDAFGKLEELAATRVYEGGLPSIEKTKNLIGAMFTHTTSRALDPQLHSHTVVQNLTQREDGMWRSLETIGMFRVQKILGLEYRASLAKRVSDLDYKISVDPKDGTFELSHIDDSLIRALSKRRAHIEKIAGEKEATTPKEMERISVSSRTSKGRLDTTDLYGRWVEELKDHGKTPQDMVNAGTAGTVKTGPASKEVEDVEAEKTVRLAIGSLSDREAVFSETEILSGSMKLGLGRHTGQDLSNALGRIISQKELVKSQLSDFKNGDLYTTQEAARKETTLIKESLAGKGEVKPMAKAIDRKGLIEKYGLNEGQSQSFELITGTEDRFVVVQGRAGVGKTYLVSAVKELAQSKGVSVIGLSPTGAAAQNLQDETGINSHTLASFLNKSEKGAQVNLKGKSLWIVDEAGLTSLNDMVRVVKLARAQNARVALIGDSKQLSSVEWGKAFELIQKNGIKTAVMDDIQRQKNAELKEAVIASIGDTPAEAVVKLGSNLVEEEDRDKRLGAMVSDYMETISGGQSTLAVIPDHKTRNEFNDLVQGRLLESGGIKKEKSHEATVLLPAGETVTERSDARFYKAGTVVQFRKEYKGLGVKPNDAYIVKQVDREGGVLRLSAMPGLTGKESPKEMDWDPSKVGGKSKYGVSLFQEKKVTFHEGDKITWKTTDKEAGLKNGYSGEIKEISGSMFKVLFQDGKIRDIDTTKNKNFELGYAVTAFGSQGKTVENVLVMAESYRKTLISQKSFYVGISRAKDTALVYTENRNNLMKAIEERTGEKTSALEHTGGYVHTDSGSTKIEAMARKLGHRLGAIKANVSRRMLELGKELEK